MLSILKFFPKSCTCFSELLRWCNFAQHARSSFPTFFKTFELAIFESCLEEGPSCADSRPYENVALFATSNTLILKPSFKSQCLHQMPNLCKVPMFIKLCFYNSFLRCSGNARNSKDATDSGLDWRDRASETQYVCICGTARPVIISSMIV